MSSDSEPDLDLLAAVCELEEYKEEKKEEVRKMNVEMAQKLKAITKPKPLAKSVVDDLDDESGLILRAKSRVLKKDALEKAVGGRQYVKLENLGEATGGLYTIGVVVDKSGVIQSKGGKKFMSLKLSDCEKCDIGKLR